MLPGVLFALAAGGLWGMIFVVPLIVPDYPGLLQSAGRNVAFGLIALPFAWRVQRQLRMLLPKDWLEALKLTLVGNLLYYGFLASAIQQTGAPVSTMIIGILPVTISITANLCYGHLEGRLRWQRLTPALFLILVGLLCVNLAELQSRQQHIEPASYAVGIGLAILALACWTWFSLRNARWLRNHPACSPSAWATAQGVITLPVAWIVWGLALLSLAVTEPDFELPFGPRPGLFLALMLVLGVFCSWLGSMCWNTACQRLPTVIVGPLIVFETLFGLFWTFLWKQSWPPLLTFSGIFCLILGVIIVMQIKPKPVVIKVC